MCLVSPFRKEKQYEANENQSLPSTQHAARAVKEQFACNLRTQECAAADLHEEIAKKIVFLIWYNNEARYEKLFYKYFKVYNEQSKQLPNVLGMNTNYSYRKFCKKTNIIIDENTHPEIVKFLNENDINTDNYSFDGTKEIYKNNIIEYITHLNI